jgi:hypothetical protein
MTRTTKRYDVIQFVGLFRVVKHPNGFNVMYVRFLTQFVDPSSTGLAAILVSLKGGPANLPPRLTVSKLSALPLMVVFTHDVLREPLSVAIRVAETSVCRGFDFLRIPTERSRTRLAFDFCLRLVRCRFVR